MPRRGDIAVVHFTGRIAEGEDAGKVFDTTDVDVALEEGVYHDYRDYKPLEFRIGEGAVVDGLDDVVREMEVGERRTVRVEPDRAFGEYDDGKVVTLPREELDGDADDLTGELVRADNGATGWVLGDDGDTVTVDFNHELAGVPVEFEVKLLDAYADD